MEAAFNLCLSRTEVNSILERAQATFRLNEEQAAVLTSVSKWFTCTGEASKGRTSEPVLLVHGVFGAGKSFLLVAFIQLIHQLAEADDEKAMQEKERETDVAAAAADGAQLKITKKQSLRRPRLQVSVAQQGHLQQGAFPRPSSSRPPCCRAMPH